VSGNRSRWNHGTLSNRSFTKCSDEWNKDPCNTVFGNGSYKWKASVLWLCENWIKFFALYQVLLPAEVYDSRYVVAVRPNKHMWFICKDCEAYFNSAHILTISVIQKRTEAKIFEKSVLRRIPGHQTVSVTGEWRELRNEKLNRFLLTKYY
jgi:hypothetical protein